MGNHSRGNWGGGHDKPAFSPAQQAIGVRGGPRPRLKPFVWAVAFIGLLVWSLLAWLAYEAADGVMGWLKANAATTLDSAKALAGPSGVAKEAITVSDGLRSTGFLGQAIDLLLGVAKPAIVVIWAAGAVMLAIGPFVLSRLAGFLNSSRGGGRGHH